MARQTGSIDYPGPALAVGEPPRALAPGLHGLRLALPFALDHVNVWLLADGASWTIIDTGIADAATRAAWQSVLDGMLRGQTVGRLLATHFHPDHMGLAAWLCARTGAALWTSRTEWLTGRALALDDSEGFVAAGRLRDRRAGLGEAQVEARAARGNLYRTRALAPPSFRRVGEGEVVTIDGAAWRVLIGRGHAPEMICLYDAERNLLLAADHVLPRISPNISVWPAEPEADPLAEFLDSLAPFRALPEDCLVLPAHGQPFRGLRPRIDELRQHHEQRLARTLEACRQPQTALAVLPALFQRPLDEHQLGFALGECLAHLNHLVQRGALERLPAADGRLLYQSR